MAAVGTAAAITGECAGGSDTGGSLEEPMEECALLYGCTASGSEEHDTAVSTSTQSVDNERLVISAQSLHVIHDHVELAHQYQGMIDSGANVNLGPVQLAKSLGLPIVPHTDGRKIGTADSGAELIIVGWIFPRGYTGPIALVKGAAFILFSVIQLQANGMGVHFPPLLPSCFLTIMEEDEEYVFLEIMPTAPTQMYFVDARKLLATYTPEYVPLPDDTNTGGALAFIGNFVTACCSIGCITFILA